MNLADQVLDGQRRAIAKAITLLESTRADHRAQGDELLTKLLPHSGKSFRIGISGVPGVGKSTFIEALGLDLIAKGHRVAVLARGFKLSGVAKPPFIFALPALMLHFSRAHIGSNRGGGVRGSSCMMFHHE